MNWISDPPRTRPFRTFTPLALLLLLRAFPASSGETPKNPETALQKLIVSGVKDTKNLRVTIKLLGAPVRAKVVSADDSGVLVRAAGMETRLSWEEIPPGTFLAIARKCLEGKPLETQALLFHFAKQKGLEDLAEKEAARILEQNPLAAYLLYPPEPEQPEPQEEQPSETDTAPNAPSPPVPPPPAPSAVLPRLGPLSTASVPASHPRIFMRADPAGDAPTVPQVLAAARKNPGTLSRSRAADMALDYLLSGNRSSARRAIELMKKPGKMGWYDAGHWTADRAIAFDWLYDYDGFSPEDKKEAAAVILKGLRECNRWTLSSGDVHYLWNGYWICAKGSICAALALYGLEKEADSTLPAVIDSIDKALRALDYADGAWMEGPTYATHTINNMIPAAEALWSATGENPYRRHPGLARFVQWFAWMTRPNWTLARWDDAAGGSSSRPDQELPVFALAAARGSRDPEAAWFADVLYKKWGSGDWTSLYGLYARLWADTAAARSLARPPSKLSEVFGMRTAGYVFARSDWSDNAFHLVFRCGDSIAPGHQHYCSNSFTIYHFGSLAIDSGEYHGQPLHPHVENYASETIAHNAVVFPDPSRPEARDGQARRFRHNLSNPESLLAPGRFECGDIIAYEDRGSFMYVAGNATRAYSGICRLWIREIVYLRPSTLIVLDRVRPGSKRVATWLMHFLEEPQVSGNAFTARAGGGSLWCGFVLPLNPRIEKVGGPGKEFWHKGRNWPPGGRSGPFHEGGKWRVEVTSPDGSGPFLSVIHTGRPGQAPPPVTPILDDPSGIGVSVGGRTVLFKRNAPGILSVQ